MVNIKKSLRLDEQWLKENKNIADNIVKELTKVSNGKVQFAIDKDKENNDIISILVYEEKLKSKAGRPLGHDFDFAKVEQLKAEGKTNKQIYTELGVSKALFYLRMKEYKQ